MMIGFGSSKKELQKSIVMWIHAISVNPNLKLSKDIDFRIFMIIKPTIYSIELAVQGC